MHSLIINDAAVESDNRWKYVDELTIVEILKKTHPSELQSHLLDSLVQWCKDNYVVPNAAKCKAMQISFHRWPLAPIVLDINSTTLEAVSSLKLLGVFLQDDLKWDGQVSRLISNASKRLCFFTRLHRNCVTTKDLATIYMLYIRPVLEFAAPVWTSGITNNQSVSIERVQRRALRIIIYPDSRTYDELQSHLDVSFLKERRTSLSLRFTESLLQSKVHLHLLPVSRVNDCLAVPCNMHLICPCLRWELWGTEILPSHLSLGPWIIINRGLGYYQYMYVVCHVFQQYDYVQYWLSWWLAQQVLPFTLILILQVLLSFLSLSHPSFYLNMPFFKISFLFFSSTSGLSSLFLFRSHPLSLSSSFFSLRLSFLLLVSLSHSLALCLSLLSSSSFSSDDVL